MDFSDIRTIIIGEAGEYGKRLVRYLEIHLSSAVRVYHFTTAEGMVSFKEEAEIYLLDERFFKELSEEKQKFLKQKKLILLTWREEQGSFCKYDNPKKLLDMLSDFTDYNSDLSDLAAELKDTPTKLTIVYSPVYDEYLEQIARSFMSSGDIYMGAEDLGYKGIDSEYEEGGDMGDLCYYIHLREENILDILQDMQFRTDSYQKLSLILIQSFTKGGREAAMLMEAEEREAFHKRIDRAKKEGEEASTRLLFPMILLLCQVMLLVMYPALTRFQGF